MRILLVSALLTLTASCAWPPPAQMAEPSPPSPVVVAAPAPMLPLPFAWLVASAPSPGRLTLNNFRIDKARVQAVITPYPDCAVREGTATSEFVLPLNGTSVIEAAPGSDVCWRRATAPGTAAGAAPSTQGWTEWNRAFLATARSVDSRL